MKKFVIYDVDRHEKIAEIYNGDVCWNMLWACWDNGIDNLQIQLVDFEEGEE